MVQFHFNYLIDVILKLEHVINWILIRLLAQCAMQLERCQPPIMFYIYSYKYIHASCINLSASSMVLFRGCKAS